MHENRSSTYDPTRIDVCGLLGPNGESGRRLVISRIGNDQMVSIGLDPNRVKHIVIGHGHWDHAGQISEFPGATLYVQKEELKQIDFFLAYPIQFNDGNIGDIAFLGSAQFVFSDSGF